LKTITARHATARGRRRRAWPAAAFLAAALWPAAAGAAERAYATQGDCDGFPRVVLDLASPLCAGLVADHLGVARGLAIIGRDVFVVDMGGWQSRHGRLLRLAEGGHGAPQVVLRDLFEPNAVLATPDRRLLVGVGGAVLRVDPFAAQPERTVRPVVTGLPTTGRHPLPALAWGPDGALFVNVGSETNNCETPAGAAPDPKAACPETLARPPRGAILRVPPQALDAGVPWDARAHPPYARGLRNAMALALLPDGRLAAAVNARDSIQRAQPGLDDAALPHDALVVVEPGADFGWPACYDDRVASPEYPGADCRARAAPALLLPAHAAPLGMLLYRGGRLPGLDGKLVIGYHGYRRTGHRLVAVGLDARGSPAGPPVELLADWSALPGIRPQGAPVGLAEMDDGSMLVADDHNGTLLRLSTSAAK
jgi:glucose/arabinose dehydrogenase